MKLHFGFMLAAIAVLISGCASVQQQPVALSHNAIGVQSGRIGIAMTALPKLDTQFPGASCLLCLAAASIANSSLTDYTHTLGYEDIPNLKIEAADLLRKKGADVTVIEENINVDKLPDFNGKGPNIALKDFSALRQKYKLDKVLVIDIRSLGFIRTYSAYIPTSDPKGILQGTGYIIDLKSNTYDWYLPVLITKSADQNWDEPPKFPGLTNAYFQAIEIGKDDFLRPFSDHAATAIIPQNVAPAVTAQSRQ